MDTPKYKCYAAKAALCLEHTARLLPGTNTSSPTLNLEVAPKLPNSDQFNWDQKIYLQLNEFELPLLCSLFLGFLPAVAFKRETKGIEFERQHAAIFVRATSAGKSPCALPIPSSHAFPLSLFLIQRLKQQTQFTDDALLLAALRSCASLDTRAPPAPARDRQRAGNNHPPLHHPSRPLTAE